MRGEFTFKKRIGEVSQLARIRSGGRDQRGIVGSLCSNNSRVAFICGGADELEMIRELNKFFLQMLTSRFESRHHRSEPVFDRFGTDFLSLQKSMLVH